LITLQQDAEGFVRMNRHYPASVRIRIVFSDGSTGEFSGSTLNNAYDAALAEFRAKNNLDARGFSRNTAGRKNSGNRIDVVRVQPGMGE
jgi:Mg-chelatase subunit ChlD